MMHLLKRCTRFEDKFWYQPSLTWLSMILLPFTGLYYLIITLRRFAYRIQLFKSYSFPVPIVIVGNIAAGGTGKTPCVIALAKHLQGQGMRVGIVSRGVGGKRHVDPAWVTENSSVEQVGDEALLMARHSGCPVVVGVNRVAAVQMLLERMPQCSVVISDDGLQHYRLRRDIEIAVIDAARGFGNGYLLPAGPLREPVRRLQEVDYLLANGGQFTNAETFILKSSTLCAVRDHKPCNNEEALKSQPIHAVAGIGNPGRFFAVLRQAGFDVIEHAFPDHYQYTVQDLMFADAYPVLMTEKDAVKCEQFADARMWYLPVTVDLDDSFLKQFDAKLAKVKSEIR